VKMEGVTKGMRFKSAFGPVRVIEVRINGALVIDETRLIKRFLRPEELFPEAGDADGSSSKAARAPSGGTKRPAKKARPGESTDLPRREEIPLSGARRTLEALRFGLVPVEGLETLTLGFDDLSRWALGRLPDANRHRPQISEIEGPFGTGKSHTCAVIRHLARKKGYATARVEVDGVAIGLSDPEALLCGLWSNLRAEGLDSASPLLELYARAIERGHPAPRITPRAIDRFGPNYGSVRVLMRRGMLEAHASMIDGLLSCSPEHTAAQVKQTVAADSGASSEVNFKRVIGRRVADRPWDFVESLVGHAIIAQRAGYRGLVITIDEFEVEISNATSTARERVANLLWALRAYLCEKTRYPAAPLSLFIATVGDDRSPGDQVLKRIVNDAGGSAHPLSPLSRSDRLELSRRIHSVYARTYERVSPFDRRMSDRVEDALEQNLTDSGLTRAFIKGYVAELDRLHGPPAVAA